MKKASAKSAAYRIVLVGALAATISCGKLVLSLLPNIEVVTLLTALYGYVFGIYGVLASVIFVSLEPLLYGFGTWVASYYLYWPFIAIVFMLLGKLKIRNRVTLTLTAVLLTIWYGVLTSLVDVGLLIGYWEDFAYRFWVMYVRGIWFYVAQIVCNTVLFSLLFKLLAEKLTNIKRHIGIR